MPVDRIAWRFGCASLLKLYPGQMDEMGHPSVIEAPSHIHCQSHSETVQVASSNPCRHVFHPLRTCSQTKGAYSTISTSQHSAHWNC